MSLFYKNIQPDMAETIVSKVQRGGKTRVRGGGQSTPWLPLRSAYDFKISKSKTDGSYAQTFHSIHHTHHQ